MVYKYSKFFKICIKFATKLGKPIFKFRSAYLHLLVTKDYVFLQINKIPNNFSNTKKCQSLTLNLESALNFE